MDRRRGPGHDRDVVRIGERRHRGIRRGEIAVLAERSDDGEDTVRDAAPEVLRIAAVEADYHRWTGRLAIVPLVQIDQLGHGCLLMCWDRSNLTHTPPGPVGEFPELWGR